MSKEPLDQKITDSRPRREFQFSGKVIIGDEGMSLVADNRVDSRTLEQIYNCDPVPAGQVWVDGPTPSRHLKILWDNPYV